MTWWILGQLFQTFSLPPCRVQSSLPEQLLPPRLSSLVIFQHLHDIPNLDGAAGLDCGIDSGLCCTYNFLTKTCKLLTYIYIVKSNNFVESIHFSGLCVDFFSVWSTIYVCHMSTSCCESESKINNNIIIFFYPIEIADRAVPTVTRTGFSQNYWQDMLLN